MLCGASCYVINWLVVLWHNHDQVVYGCLWHGRQLPCSALLFCKHFRSTRNKLCRIVLCCSRLLWVLHVLRCVVWHCIFNQSTCSSVPLEGSFLFNHPVSEQALRYAVLNAARPTGSSFFKPEERKNCLSAGQLFSILLFLNGKYHWCFSEWTMCKTNLNAIAFPW